MMVKVFLILIFINSISSAEPTKLKSNEISLFLFDEVLPVCSAKETGKCIEKWETKTIDQNKSKLLSFGVLKDFSQRDDNHYDRRENSAAIVLLEIDKNGKAILLDKYSLNEVIDSEMCRSMKISFDTKSYNITRENKALGIILGCQDNGNRAGTVIERLILFETSTSKIKKVFSERISFENWNYNKALKEKLKLTTKKNKNDQFYTWILTRTSQSKPKNWPSESKKLRKFKWIKDNLVEKLD